MIATLQYACVRSTHLQKYQGNAKRTLFHVNVMIIELMDFDSFKRFLWLLNEPITNCLPSFSFFLHFFVPARVKRALVDKGVAVFKGGMSSLLAFILLAFSRSYVYTTFFKVIWTSIRSWHYSVVLEVKPHAVSQSLEFPSIDGCM